MPTRPVQREHELGAEPLAVRMEADLGFQLADHLCVSPEVEICVEEVLHALQSALFEPCRLQLCERLRELAERDATPEP